MARFSAVAMVARNVFLQLRNFWKIYILEKMTQKEQEAFDRIFGKGGDEKQ
jgi:hypothetical protein